MIESLGMTLATPYFTGRAKRKKDSCGFAKSSRGGGGGKKPNFGKDLLLSVPNRLTRSQALQPI